MIRDYSGADALEPLDDLEPLHTARIIQTNVNVKDPKPTDLQVELSKFRLFKVNNVTPTVTFHIIPLSSVHTFPEGVEVLVHYTLYNFA